jgi:hypothetical protein
MAIARDSGAGRARNARRRAAEAEAAAIVGAVLPSFAAFLQQVTALPSVERVIVSHDDAETNIWVLVRTEVDADVDRVWALERAHLRDAELVSLEVHVVPLDRVDLANLPAGEVIYPLPEATLAP